MEFKYFIDPKEHNYAEMNDRRVPLARIKKISLDSKVLQDKVNRCDKERFVLTVPSNRPMYVATGLGSLIASKQKEEFRAREAAILNKPKVPPKNYIKIFKTKIIGKVRGLIPRFFSKTIVKISLIVVLSSIFGFLLAEYTAGDSPVLVVVDREIEVTKTISKGRVKSRVKKQVKKPKVRIYHSKTTVTKSDIIDYETYMKYLYQDVQRERREDNE